MEALMQLHFLKKKTDTCVEDNTLMGELHPWKLRINLWGKAE